MIDIRGDSRDICSLLDPIFFILMHFWQKEVSNRFAPILWEILDPSLQHEQRLTSLMVEFPFISLSIFIDVSNLYIDEKQEVFFQ